jgi:hypothetical protein
MELMIEWLFLRAIQEYYLWVIAGSIVFGILGLLWVRKELNRKP